MGDVIGALVETYDLDAVFLDQTLLAFNVSRGPNFLDGMRRHIETIQARFPKVLFAGEGLHEHVLRPLNVAQIHGIDSITGVHGLDETVRWRDAHPVSAHLFSPYTRLLAHLLTKHPSHPVFPKQEAAYARLGVVPAIVCYDRDDRLDIPEVETVLERARSLSQPDYGGAIR
jgi:hypothetical protein